MNIYVANLGQETSEEQVRSAFSNYGEVESVKLITDQFTGRLKGFGFIEMPNTEEAEEAIKELNNSKFDNQFLVVNEARPKASNNGFSSNNRGSYSRSNDRQY
jgi:RNA recognition motif-containing protein